MEVTAYSTLRFQFGNQPSSRSCRELGLQSIWEGQGRPSPTRVAASYSSLCPLTAPWGPQSLRTALSQVLPSQTRARTQEVGVPPNTPARLEEQVGGGEACRAPAVAQRRHLPFPGPRSHSATAAAVGLLLHPQSPDHRRPPLSTTARCRPRASARTRSCCARLRTGPQRRPHPLAREDRSPGRAAHARRAGISPLRLCPRPPPSNRELRKGPALDSLLHIGHCA